MPDFHTLASTILKVLIIILAFNLIIFVHELGHFLAAKWRGLKVERFQIWFGKPIWKKTMGGVQYGIGWIPAGGFVALPQMAPMEAIEGANKEGSEPLSPISPLDKIIVAFAGPLFSVLLALLAATIVWKIGKPADFIPSQIVGEVVEGSPGQKAGILKGDKILEINGEAVDGFTGKLNSIFERIVLSKGDTLSFTIQRDGVPEPLHLTSKFDIEPTKWYQRRGLRRVGIGPQFDHVAVAAVVQGSPAERAGLKEEDTLVSFDGKPIPDTKTLLEWIKEKGTTPFKMAYQRSGVSYTAELTAEEPVVAEEKGPKIGLAPTDMPFVDARLNYPGPFRQVKDSLSMMWETLTGLLAPSSSIGVDQLSGPIGIFKVKFQMLGMDHPANRILAFFVIFNVNLAVFNMLPLPVLDGGHITLALMEAATRRPVRARALEIVQTAFVFLLLSLFLYVASKDAFSDMGRGKAVKTEFRKR